MTTIIYNNMVHIKFNYYQVLLINNVLYYILFDIQRGMITMIYNNVTHIKFNYYQVFY